MGRFEKPEFFQGLCLKIQAQIFSGFLARPDKARKNIWASPKSPWAARNPNFEFILVNL
jgi:hypothetical protein